MKFLSSLKWNNQVVITKDLIYLLLIGGLYSLSVSLSNTFVNVFLWRQTNDFFLIGLYNLTIVIIQPITFIFAGRLAKQIDRIIVFRIGVVLLALYYVSVLLSGEKAADYLLLLGALLGMGYGFYWLAYNVLTFEITEPENRDFFNGFQGVLGSIGGMSGPLIAGFMISKFIGFVGYTIIFGMSLALFAIASVLTFFMKRRPAEGRFSFIKIVKERKQNRDWKMITNANLFQGIREGIFAFVINIYVYITTSSEMALGTFAFLNSFISFITYFFAGKYIKPKHRYRSIFIGGILLFAATFTIVINTTYTSFLIYSATIAFAYPLVLVPFMSISYDVIGRGWKAREMRIEYIVVRELYLNIGRTISILIFLFVITQFSLEKSITYLLICLGSGYTWICWFVRKLKPEEIKGGD